MDMMEVVEYYYQTIDKQHPEGNMKEVADHFKITRAKVQKILFTMEAIDSPLHQDIMKLKEEGYDNEDIASMLGVSVSTVSINLPYAKPMYGQDEKSRGAIDVENYRKREKVFLEGQKRKATALEIMREAYLNSPEHLIAEMMHFDNVKPVRTDDTVNLEPVFNAEETRLFQVHPDVIILHIELMGDYDPEILKKYGGVKYGETISRDILVHHDMPLHNLHYLIQQIFGFQNYHLHNFQMPTEQLVQLTDRKAANWCNLMGVIFKNPLRNEDSDFWDDDYDGGSPKKYMRSKYTGPYRRGVYDETYQMCREDIEHIKEIVGTDNDVLNLPRKFELDPFDILERLPISQVLNLYDDEEVAKSYGQYMEDMDECIDYVKGKDADEFDSQPFVYSFTKELIYSYDYGDGWKFKITPVSNAQGLIDAGRIQLSTLRNDIKHICEYLRPVLLAADGYSLIEDVGGESGYCAFLKGIHGEDCGGYDYEDATESRKWAGSLGWKENVPSRSIV